MAVNFIKMHGAGNDFVVIDCRNQEVNLSFEQIKKISARQNVGCDQLLLLQETLDADIFMKIYNSDGSISAACGNATRCVAQIIMEELQKNEVNIKTDAGILKAQKIDDLIWVNMGLPKLSWQEIPVREECDIAKISLENRDFFAVNMGNPHIVTFLAKGEDLAGVNLLEIGPKLENSQLFPERTNIEFVKIVAANHLQIRVWERGAGETLACGTGACAVFVAAISQGLILLERNLRLSFPGGDLFVRQNDDGMIFLSGEVEKIYEGVLC